jgi:hypothetical protein
MLFLLSEGAKTHLRVSVISIIFFSKVIPRTSVNEEQKGKGWELGKGRLGEERAGREVEEKGREGRRG